MNSENAICVLVADDHPIWREGLVAAIQSREGMKVVAEASNGEQAVELFRVHRPDVTLMDLRMPEMDGLAALTSIRAEFPSARIIMLTTFDSEEDIYRGVHAGAQGYLLKSVSHEELLEAIRKVHSGQKYLPFDVASRLAERMQTVELSERELDVLRLIAQGRSNKEIASTLFVVEGTVKAHVSNILAKLAANDRTQAVTIAIKRGILHPN